MKMELKTQQDCWKALVEGHILERIDANIKIKFVDGEITQIVPGKIAGIDASLLKFAVPGQWRIYSPVFSMQQIEAAYNKTVGYNYFLLFRTLQEELLKHGGT